MFGPHEKAPGKCECVEPEKCGVRSESSVVVPVVKEVPGKVSGIGTCGPLSREVEASYKENGVLHSPSLGKVKVALDKTYVEPLSLSLYDGDHVMVPATRAMKGENTPRRKHRC